MSLEGVFYTSFMISWSIGKYPKSSSTYSFFVLQNSCPVFSTNPRQNRLANSWCTKTDMWMICLSCTGTFGWKFSREEIQNSQEVFNPACKFVSFQQATFANKGCWRNVCNQDISLTKGPSRASNFSFCRAGPMLTILWQNHRDILLYGFDPSVFVGWQGKPSSGDLPSNDLSGISIVTSKTS